MKLLNKFTWINALKIKRIVPKMLLGYFVLVVFPVILFGSFFIYQLYNNALDSYAKNKQNLVTQSANSLEVNLAQVNSIYSLFQFNPTVVDYLNAQHLTEASQVYTYLKFIRPIFSFVSSSNPSIQSIKLYKTNEEVLSVPSEVEDISSIEAPYEEGIFKGQEVNQGVWLPIDHGDSERIPFISYYQRIFDSNYSKELAVFNVIFNEELLNNFLKTVALNDSVEVLIGKNNEIIYRSNQSFVSHSQLDQVIETFSDSDRNYWLWQENKLLINHIYMDDLKLDFYFVSPIDIVFEDIYQRSILYGIIFLGLLVFLSSIYYLTASVLTKRVQNLAKHMRGVDESKLSLYEGDKGEDEIGYLTQSYNSLMIRIDELMNKVHLAELRKKEADYLALQAQVNPHFLYNTLESIRMLAEINDNSEVVEATFTLSKLLRYSLSTSRNVTTIQDEIENVKDYLSIHKIRMMDRLSYEIDIKTEIRNVNCPPLILQPLVENCMNHSISKMRNQGIIKVTLEEKDSFLKIVIFDNGPGIPKERLETIQKVLANERDKSELETTSSGLGLYNVSERIKSYFGEESRLEIKSELDLGTSCILMLKIKGEE